MSSYDRPVSDYMRAPVLTATVDEDLQEVERRLRVQRISCVPVVGRDGNAAGVISQTDLLQVGHVLARSTGAQSTLQLPAGCVGDTMTTRVIATAPETPLREAARLMVERRVHRLFVLADGKPVGVLSTRDLLRAIIEERVRGPLANYMTVPAVTVSSSEPLSIATQRLYEARHTGVVVTEAGLPVGLFTQLEALAAREMPTATPVGEVVGHSLICLLQATPLHRVASFARATNVRRVLALDGETIAGIAVGLDFARAIIA